MKSLPGNQHADALKLHQDFGNTLSPTVQATLALAFEQRTATLVSLHQYAADKLVDGHVHGDEEEYAAHLDMLCDEINLRIGKPNDEAFRAGS